MKWPTKIRFSDIERILEMTTVRTDANEVIRPGWDALALLEDAPDGEVFPAWDRLHRDPRLSIEVLFWWSMPDGGDEASKAEFKKAIEDDEIYSGMVALETALDSFIKAATRNPMFGVMARKARAATLVIHQELTKAVESIDDRFLLATGDEKSGVSPDHAEETPAPTPSGS